MNPKDWDIICIQEPYFDWQGLSRATNGWTPIYPPRHKKGEKTRSLTLISPFIATDAWEALPVNSLDITAVKLSCDFGHIRLFNLYNACEHAETTTALAKYLSESAVEADTSISVYDIWAGDFNRHDPMWENPRYKQLFTRRHLDDAEVLISMMADYGMEMALPPGIPTLEHMVSKELHRVDQVFISAELSDYIIKCDTLKSRPPRSDHYPIVTTIDLDIARTLPPAGHNFRATDWPEFRKELQKKMDRLTLHDPRNSTEFEAILDDVMDAILTTIESNVPRTRPSAYMKRWWSKELTQMRARTRALGKKSYHARLNDPTHAVHEEHRRARNDYADLIDSSKKNCWEDFVTETEEKTMYIINKFVTMDPTDGGRTRIPTLKVKQPDGTFKDVADNKGKGEALHNTFFTPPATENHVPPDYEYPAPPEQFKAISDKQIHRTIKQISPYKAPGPDGVSNSVYTHCADILVPWLGKLFRATFRLKYYPARWQVYDTIVLRKAGKPDYTVTKAYRPIALLITMAKILSACVAQNVSYVAEKHQLLPSKHFGGRPGRTTTDSLHHLVKWVRDSLRQGLVVSALFLDISGAFPNVSIPMLIHNMRKRGIPEEYTQWLDRRLDGRKTSLHFDGYKTELFNVNNGLEQGCSGSPLWFLFSNADLIEDSKFSKNETGAAFIDDTYYAARAKTPEESNAMLVRIMTGPGGALEWAKAHHACFELEKNALMIFSNKRIPDPTRPGKTMPAFRPSITINGHVNIPVETTKFLGLILDQGLTFKQHTEYAVAKGQFWINQTKRVSKTVKGMQGVFSRKLYLSVCVPRMLYGASIWLNPVRRADNTRTKGSVGAAAALSRIQRIAALHITGGMRTSPTDLLNAHADLLPMELLIDKTCHREAIRLATLPATHPLHRAVLNASKRLPKRLPSPMHNVLHAFHIHPQHLEKIAAYRHNTRWRSQFTIVIAKDKEAAIEEEKRDKSEVKIYTDGSGFQKTIGAAAVLFRGTNRRSLRYKLGDETEHTVFEGEVVGTGLGTELLRTERRAVRTASMYIDNQASMRSSQSFRSTPGHYLTDHLHRQMQRVFKRHPNLKLRLCWIPGHRDVEGNEAVDIEAKNAVTIGSSADHELPVMFRSKKPLPQSKSAAKQAYAARLKVRCSTMFSKSPRYVSFSRIDKSAPSNKYQKLVRKLPRPQASIIAQLRMGHAPLNKHLHRIKVVDSPMCKACEMEEETVIHYLLMCPAHEWHRRPMIAEFGTDAKSIQFILTEPKALKYLLRYINATERFKPVFGPLAPPQKPPPRKKKSQRVRA